MLYAAQNPIEVYIQSVEKGTRYTEYPCNDDGSLSKDESRVCYIEAVDNDQYSIVVVLRKGFLYRRAKGVEIRYQIDDALDMSWWHAKPESKEVRKSAQTYVKDSTWITIDDHPEKVTFRFGKLELDENIEKDDDSSAVGRIRVSIWRGNEVAVRRKKPTEPDTQRVQKPKKPSTEKVEKPEQPYLPKVGGGLSTSFEGTMSKSLFKKGISHSTMFVGTGTQLPSTTAMSTELTEPLESLEPAEPAEPVEPVKSVEAKSLRELGRTVKIKPSEGIHGREFVFEFYYRSRTALQHLGRIPYTPIIEPQQDTASSNPAGNVEGQVTTAAEAGNATDGGSAQAIKEEPSGGEPEQLQDASNAQPAAPTATQAGTTADGGSIGGGKQQPPSVKREPSPAPPSAPPAAPPAKRAKTVDLTLEDSPPLPAQHAKREMKGETPLVPLTSIPTLDLTAEEHGTGPAIKNEPSASRPMTSSGRHAGVSAASGAGGDEDMDEEAMRLRVEEIQLRLKLKQLEKAKARTQL